MQSTREFDPRRLASLIIDDSAQTYDWRDAALYALGTGAGGDPLDRATLGLVSGPELHVLPSFATVLGYKTFWAAHPAAGIDVARVLHGEQSLRVTRPLPTSGRVIRRTDITDIIDRGIDKGAFVRVRETIVDSLSGDVLAEMASTVICRGEGGRGGTATVDALPPLDPLPERAPDILVAIPGNLQQALLYRLSGDLNPLHSDPEVALKAGFERPVLHGLASFGMACRVLIEQRCGGDPTSFRAMHARFSRPLFPGEDTELAIWRDSGGEARFRLNAVGRGVTVLDQGRLELAEGED